MVKVLLLFSPTLRKAVQRNKKCKEGAFGFEFLQSLKVLEQEPTPNLTPLEESHR